MFNIPAHIGLTKYALERSEPAQVEAWDGITGGFMDHLDEVNNVLKKAGRPALEDHVVVQRVLSFEGESA